MVANSVKSNTAARIMVIVAEETSQPLESLSLEMRFKEDLNADSLDIVQCLMMLEEEFNIEAPDEETWDIKTVGELIAYIEGKIAG